MQSCIVGVHAIEQSNSGHHGCQAMHFAVVVHSTAMLFCCCTGPFSKVPQCCSAVLNSAHVVIVAMGAGIGARRDRNVCTCAQQMSAILVAMCMDRGCQPCSLAAMTRSYMQLAACHVYAHTGTCICILTVGLAVVSEAVILGGCAVGLIHLLNVCDL